MAWFTFSGISVVKSLLAFRTLFITQTNTWSRIAIIMTSKLVFPAGHERAQLIIAPISMSIPSTCRHHFPLVFVEAAAPSIKLR
jgi:hypothetical protein